jgi:hypothetical protein
MKNIPKKKVNPIRNVKMPLLFLLFFSTVQVQAQIGADYVYDFLGLPASARETALGSSLITIADEDLSLAYANPALLNEKMHNRIVFNHNFLFADIVNGYVAYAHTFSNVNITMHGGIKYIDYGEFELADLFGNIDGNFSANEWSAHIGASKKLNERFSVGVNLKYIQSQLAGYNSSGIGSDIGALYYVPESEFSLAISLKNIGTEVSSYRDELGISPVDLQIGLSKKLKYLPFRFSVIAHSLQQWDLRYESTLDEEVDIFGEVIDQSDFSNYVDNFFRHFIFNGEFLIGKNQNLRLRIGYNHQRRKELAVSSFRSLGGFSFGFGVKVSKFRLDYGVGHYHLAGGANHLSISVDLDDFRKNREL